jgi:hypothetical protein
VSFKALLEKGLINETNPKVKILGPGKLTKKLKFKDVILTKNLLADYEAAKTKPAITEKPADMEVPAKKPAAGKSVAKKPAKEEKIKAVKKSSSKKSSK